MTDGNDRPRSGQGRVGGTRRTSPHTPVAGHGHSLPIGRVAGIPLRLHWTFFLLIAFAVAVEWGEGAHSVVTGLVWIVALFTSVVLHELAHCIVARRRGARVIGIVLFPLGGLSQVDAMPIACGNTVATPLRATPCKASLQKS